jgi:hypothetical protein
MLDVTYEAVDDLMPGQLAVIEEDRGRIRFRLDKTRPLADVVRKLNIEIDRVLSTAHWFQLWGDEIISRNTPGSPLRIEYLLQREEADGVRLEERKGLVSVLIDPNLDTEQFAAAMNPTVMGLLDGGQWFQLFAGEIIDNSPESLSQV